MVKRNDALVARLTLAMLVSTFVLAPQAVAEEPEYGLLRYAQWLYGDGAHDELRLVQSEEEISQPTDFEPVSTSAESTGSGREGRARLDFSNLEEITQPSFQSLSTASVNSTAEVAAVEQITQQPISTGVVQTAPLEIIPASTYSVINTPDVAESITRVASSPTVKARRRSPISLEPRIRGYTGGQLYTTLDGAFIGPVRNDLDGVLSKVDKSLIGTTEIISGPYGLRYGSGFAFVSVDTIPPPRYECGWENHLRLGTQFRTNGGQAYNTATLFGGGQRVGYYANIGYRRGSDYEAGNGLDIPSSYEAMNIFSALEVDVTDNTRLLTRFSHINQGDTDYAAQFFDVSELLHYGITQSIIHQDDDLGFGFRIDGWYSDTSFDGDTLGDGKRRDNFPVLQRVDEALKIATGAPPTSAAEFQGLVDGDITIAGVRAGARHEFDEESSVSAGVDFRYVEQRIDENYDISQFPVAPGAAQFDTGLPTAETFDPGLYLEFATGMTQFWNLALGGRVAFDSTRADGSTLSDQSNFKDVNGNIIRDLDVSDILYSWYATNDLTLSRVWRGRIGVGYAERLPDLTERYSDGLFLSVIQSGFSRVIGNPELSKERNWQVDLRADGEYEHARVRLTAFHAFILDYITYAANAVNDPLGARLLQAINTEYATLLGAEAYGEVDLYNGLQVFGSFSYLDGRDREINQPLPNIYPIEAQAGIRLRDHTPRNAWGLEWGVRIVDNQDRLGTLRPVTGGNDPITLESETDGFTTSYIRAYLNPYQGVSLTGGVENVFDRDYIDHLSLRLPADGPFGPTQVLSPGITPYFGIELEY